MDNVIGFLDHTAEQWMDSLRRELKSLEQAAQSIRKQLDDPDGPDVALNWWGHHTQGLVYSANHAESLMNKVLAYRHSVEVIRQVKESQQ